MLQSNESDKQQLISYYQELKKAIEMAYSQKNIILSNISSINESIKKIKEIDKYNNKEEVINVNLPLGNGCFIETNIKTPINNLLINIGSGVIIKKNIIDSIEYMNNKKTNLEKSVEELNNSISSMSQKLYEIEEQMNK